MDNFKDLLKIYSQRLNSSQLIIDEILEVINKITSLKLSKTNLSLRDGVGWLKIKPKEKLLIILYKEKILTKFKEENISVIDLK